MQPIFDESLKEMRERREKDDTPKSYWVPASTFNDWMKGAETAEDKITAISDNILKLPKDYREKQHLMFQGDLETK